MYDDWSFLRTPSERLWRVESNCVTAPVWLFWLIMIPRPMVRTICFACKGVMRIIAVKHEEHFLWICLFSIVARRTGSGPSLQWQCALNGCAWWGWLASLIHFLRPPMYFIWEHQAEPFWMGCLDRLSWWNSDKMDSSWAPEVTLEWRSDVDDKTLNQVQFVLSQNVSGNAIVGTKCSWVCSEWWQFFHSIIFFLTFLSPRLNPGCMAASRCRRRHRFISSAGYINLPCPASSINSPGLQVPWIYQAHKHHQFTRPTGSIDLLGRQAPSIYPNQKQKS